MITTHLKKMALIAVGMTAMQAHAVNVDTAVNDGNAIAALLKADAVDLNYIIMKSDNIDASQKVLQGMLRAIRADDISVSKVHYDTPNGGYDSLLVQSRKLPSTSQTDVYGISKFGGFSPWYVQRTNNKGESQ